MRMKSIFRKEIYRIHQEHERRQSDLRKQYDLIQNQLRFENDRTNDIESMYYIDSLY